MLTDLERRVLGAIPADPLYGLTAELVRRPSVSGDEKTVAEYLASFLDDQGFATALSDAEPGRPNVSTAWGDGEGPTILLTGHIDTVPIGAGWQRDPFGAEIDGGRMYGRGASDMKSGLAAMIFALMAVRGALPKPRGRVVFAGCVDEEETGKGTQAAIKDGLTADWAIIGEPTDLQPIRAAKGNCYFEVSVAGKSAHAGSPERGVNAIYGAAAAIQSVQAHHRDLARRRHPLLGAPSVSVGKIGGGFAVSAVPDACSFWVDRRLLPGESGAAALAELGQWLRRTEGVPQGAVISERLAMELPGMETPAEHGLVKALAEAARDAGGPDMPVGGWPAACDGGYLQRDAHMPVVLFGPGSIVTEAHRPNESVPLAEILTAARTYALLLTRALSP